MRNIEPTEQDRQELEQIEYELMIDCIRVIMRMQQPVISRRKLARSGVPGTMIHNLIFGGYLDPITETDYEVMRANCESELKQVARKHTCQRKLSGWSA